MLEEIEGFVEVDRGGVRRDIGEYQSENATHIEYRMETLETKSAKTVSAVLLEVRVPEFCPIRPEVLSKIDMKSNI